jgi:hypothetical protein
MVNTRHLSQQHQQLLRLARELAGCAADLRSSGDAMTVRRVIDNIDSLLVEHLSLEDRGLYPVLMTADDPKLREDAMAAVEDMGGLYGVWVWYRSHWTLGVILADPVRFRMTTGDIVGALSLRIEMEEATLYPAFDSLNGGWASNAA